MLVIYLYYYWRLSPPYGAAAPQCRGRVAQIGHSGARAVGIARLRSLTDAEVRAAAHFYHRNERAVGGGVYAVQRAVGVSSVRAAVLGYGAALVAGLCAVFTHIPSVCSADTCSLWL